MSIIEKIKLITKTKRKILFTTPSHSQGAFINPELSKYLGKKYFEVDYSETDGFDNLRAPKGILKKLQSNISQIYGSKASFILTNGSTSGILSAMLSTLAENDKVLIARNSHISVYNGLVLTGAQPIWFMPRYNHDWGIFHGITVDDIKESITKIQNIKALIVTSPTYEGVYSDIEQLSKLCKEHNIILIVDEAHGALTKYLPNKQMSAIELGADISVQSLHKTAGAPNPCALLHINKYSTVCPDKIQQSLNLINTTSPSYPHMIAIESTINYLNSKKGAKHIKQIVEWIEKFKKSLNKNIEIYSINNDVTKLVIKINGLSAEMLSEILNNQYNIEEELVTDNSLLFLTGIGTTEKKLKKLASALNQISTKNNLIHKTNNKLVPTIPEYVDSPRIARAKKNYRIEAKDAKGKIAAEPIMAYPPGIPIIIAGERIEDTNMLEKIQDSILVYD